MINSMPELVSQHALFEGMPADAVAQAAGSFCFRGIAGFLGRSRNSRSSFLAMTDQIMHCGS